MTSVARDPGEGVEPRRPDTSNHNISAHGHWLHTYLL